MKNILSLKKIILLFGDILVFSLTLYLTLVIRYLDIFLPENSNKWQGHIGPFTGLFFVWVIIFYMGNLYNLHYASNNSKFFQLFNRSMGFAIVSSLIFFYANPYVGISPKVNLFLFIIFFYILFFLWRRLFNLSLKSYLPKTNIAIIGLDAQAAKLTNELKNLPHLGYNVSFIVNDQQNAGNGYDTGNTPIIQGIDTLSKNITDYKINLIILNANPHNSPELRAALFSFLKYKIGYMSLPNFYENITGKIPLELLSQMWFLENLSEGNKVMFDRFKRFYDLILSLFILIITLPFWPLIAIYIKHESKGPAFFKQTRTGLNNKPFTLIKFRTMKMENNNFAPTGNNDNRITKFGNFLRKTRIDEIPQILNIISGDMSFVGPRPERPELISELAENIPFYNERMLVKPGLTGWDQVSGEYHSPSREDTIKKLQYDLFYIKNRSIYLDLAILLRTVATVISQKGI